MRAAWDITLISLSSLPSRLGSSLVMVTGTACVVAVLCGLLAMAAGLEASTSQSTRDDRGLVLRTGSITELLSYGSGTIVDRVSQIDGVKAISGELLFYLTHPDFEGSQTSMLLLRAVDQSWAELRPELRIVAGREFEPGKLEAVVGLPLLTRHPGLDIGDKLQIYQGELTIVGHFEAGGSMDESTLFADIEVFRNLYRRGRAISAARVLLDAPQSFLPVQAAVDADPQASIYFAMEEEVYAEQISGRKSLVESFAYWVLGIMAIGAIVASLSTMYATVQSRRREIATLRALGYPNPLILVSLLAESVLLALVGSSIGVGLIYALYDGMQTSTTGGFSTTLVFAFSVTPQIAALSVALAIALGIVGGIAAFWQSARVPVATALLR